MSIDTGLLPKIEYDGIASDIDETLSCTIDYWVAQMQKLFGNPEHLSVEELVKKYRYTQNIPYWQSPEVLSWTEEQRNSNIIQTKLPLIKGANIYLNKIHLIIPVVAYISIRPDIVVRGTQQWLNMYGFPKAPVICRPKNVPLERGSEWKARVLEKLYPKVKGIIDDNHSVLDFFNDDYAGTVFLFNHEKTLDSKIRNVPGLDWEITYNNVKHYF